MSNASIGAPGLGRRVVAALWSGILLPYFVLALGVPLARAAGIHARVHVSWLAALSVLAGVALGAGSHRSAAALPASLDDFFATGPRILVALWAAGGLFALRVLGRMAVFLGDPARVDCSFAPGDAFLSRHSCLTAYMHGALLSRIPGANVYDMAFVETARGAPLPPTAAHFAPFNLDAFGYPPPFLLLPRALLLLTADFPSQRILFGALSLSLTLLACALVARTLGGRTGHRVWLLAPLFVAQPVCIATLQVGNFHLAAVALCLLTWVALEGRREGLAGSLLAVATLAKIFPGLLGVVLLMQRRWRAVGATAVAAALLCALSLVALGAGVWRDFLYYQLPRVQSGEALRFLAETPREVAFNLAPFGLPFKLQALGLARWGWPEARLLGTLYTLALLVLGVLGGRNAGSATHRLRVWLALLMLASLRSPYAAPFVLVTVVLLFLLFAAVVRTRGEVVALLLAMLFFLTPTPPLSPGATMALSLFRAVSLWLFLAGVVLRRERPPAEATPA